MLSEDGPPALIGGTGQLSETDSGEAITLAVGCAALSGSELPRLTMDASGSRFLYLANDYHHPAPLSLLELNPVDVPTSAPMISDVTIDPATIEAGTEVLGTVSARIESAETPAVCLLSLRGIVDDTFGGVGLAAPLTDGGQNGDVTTGDGIYTSNALQAQAGAFDGPRTIRIKAEVIDADGFRTATAIDVEPFAVDGVTPPDDDVDDDDAATDDGGSTAQGDPDEQNLDIDIDDGGDSGETPGADDGEGSTVDPSDDVAAASGDWSAWVGEPSATGCTVDPLTADELVELVVGAAAQPPDTSVIPLQVDDADQLPDGDPLDDETTGAVLDGVTQLAACLNAGDTGRLLSNFTPNGLAALFAYIGFPLSPMDDEAIADLRTNAEETLAAAPFPLAEDERATIDEIRDVRVLEDGRVLVISVGNSGFGEQLGYLVLVEDAGRWLVDATGVIGEPVEIDFGP